MKRDAMAIELDPSMEIKGYNGTIYNLPKDVGIRIVFIGLENNMMDGQDNQNYLLKVFIVRNKKKISYDFHASIYDTRVLITDYTAYSFILGKMVHNSLASYRRNKAKALDSVVYGVLSSIGLDSGDYGYTFEDFCLNFGYDTDSRKALDTYLAGQKISTDLHSIFSVDELDCIRNCFQ